MKILFLSLLDFDSIEEHNIYTDLIRKFRNSGHMLYAVSPVERRKKTEPFIIEEDNCRILKLKIGNIQKTNYLEKGISLLRLQKQYIGGIEHYFQDVKFDLILYATPPVTLYNVVKTMKKKHNAITYLLLKDIWPQGMVDLGVISANSLLYHYFRGKEKKMYSVSDYIGCMSENNVEYLLKHNPELNANSIEVCPNSIEPLSVTEISPEQKNLIRKNYGLPADKIIFLYGGNLGRPQGLDFLLQVIEKCEEEDCFFLIVGDGTEYQRVQNAVSGMDEKKVRLIKYLPKEEYEQIVCASDVGMVFLSPEFTVPNIPSRILSYMQYSLPMLAATDNSTDIKRIYEEADMGYWCFNGDIDTFLKHVKKLKNNKVREKMGENGRAYLEKHYTAEICYEVIMKHAGKEGAAKK